MTRAWLFLAAAALWNAGAGWIDACRRRLLKKRSPRASRVTHVLLFLGIAAVCNATSVFAQATITLTTHDPRQDPDITEREWGARLRNFRTPASGSEIYVGSGDLSFAGNRKVADLVWNNPPGLNNFTLTYAPALPPALARITMNASGSTSAGQFYDLQTQANQSFSDLLIELKSPAGNPQIIITESGSDDYRRTPTTTWGTSCPRRRERFGR